MHANGVTFQIVFDFVDHRLVISTNSGAVETFELADGLSVAEFDEKLHAMLTRLGIDIAIRETPFGVPMTTPFPADREHASYDQDAICASGGSSTGRTASSRSSPGGTAERPARFISSGTPSILQSPGSVASGHRRCRTLIESTARRTHTSLSRSASGPATRTCASRATTPTPRRSRPTSGGAHCIQRKPSGLSWGELARTPSLRGGTHGRRPESNATRLPRERLSGRRPCVRLGCPGPRVVLATRLCGLNSGV